MTAGAVWMCQKHQRAIAEGAECHWCLQDENVALRALVKEQDETIKENMRAMAVGIRFRTALLRLVAETDLTPIQTAIIREAGLH